MPRLRTLIFRIVFYSWAMLYCLLWSPMLLVPAVPRRWHTAFQKSWTIGVCFFLRYVQGLKCEVRGTENISDKPVIYAMKHQSMLDTFIMHPLVVEPAFIMKAELLNIPLYGIICERAGNISIDRDMGAKSMKKMLIQSRRATEDGQCVIIFPEGSRANPGEKHPYMPGIFGIYKYLKIPVVPVAVNTGLYWQRDGQIKKGTFVVEFLPPIEPGLQKKDFMTRLEDNIENASERLLTE